MLEKRNPSKAGLAQAYSLSKRGEGPNPIDIHVGQRLRLRRTLLGLSQETLGEAVGITFQQLQKYERGANRISASRLFNLSQVLGVPVTFFFDDLPASESSLVADEPSETQEFESMARRETLELVRAYYRIPEESVRRRTFELVKTLAGDPEDSVKAG
ncbi:helix-turn-helix domain-containing protein [Niveispirillum sp.]|uniref:helix-turn-helix domain-containing protein n=1 Tax=Niveispirillum sp. TaxID=1917217 RepID=UPI001B7795EC|nr:helix-turn-helix transcriptional regulator [Niveispirillum sp.]MBP7339004.1 helix-turn-helix transcriptional regulator [Niveispirillum sp.]